MLALGDRWSMTSWLGLKRCCAGYLAAAADLLPLVATLMDSEPAPNAVAKAGAAYLHVATQCLPPQHAWYGWNGCPP